MSALSASNQSTQFEPSLLYGGSWAVNTHIPVFAFNDPHALANDTTRSEQQHCQVNQTSLRSGRMHHLTYLPLPVFHDEPPLSLSENIAHNVRILSRYSVSLAVSPRGKSCDAPHRRMGVRSQLNGLSGTAPADASMRHVITAVTSSGYTVPLGGLMSVHPSQFELPIQVPFAWAPKTKKGKGKKYRTLDCVRCHQSASMLAVERGHIYPPFSTTRASAVSTTFELGTRHGGLGKTSSPAIACPVPYIKRRQFLHETRAHPLWHYIDYVAQPVPYTDIPVSYNRCHANFDPRLACTLTIPIPLRSGYVPKKTPLWPTLTPTLSVSVPARIPVSVPRQQLAQIPVLGLAGVASQTCPAVTCLVHSGASSDVKGRARAGN
ncbi:hypothetical protein EI94DRAFT_1702578 [Lactarius quietus]|nr:hypothetical protein EI94DRAFT_1702578 [Lactarius quietus]